MEDEIYLTCTLMAVRLKTKINRLAQNMVTERL